MGVITKYDVSYGFIEHPSQCQLDFKDFFFFRCWPIFGPKSKLQQSRLPPLHFRVCIGTKGRFLMSFD